VSASFSKSNIAAKGDLYIFTEVFKKREKEKEGYDNVIVAENSNVRVTYKIDEVASVSKGAQSDRIEIFIGGRKINFKTPPKLENNVILVPLMELLNMLTIVSSDILNFSKDGKIISVSMDNVNIRLFLREFYAEINGNRVNIPVPLRWGEDDLYVPLEFFGKALGYNVDVSSNTESKEYRARITSGKRQSLENYLNSLNIYSKTEYLIWVSKENFLVTLFKGRKGDWKYVDSFVCSLGSLARPTVVGQFEYFKLEDRWKFDNFYVGPVMVFYGKYGIHSTLLKYDGSSFDYRLKMNISHGCIRLRPEDINWLSGITPIGTRVLVTK
jgi:hypothetical protein